MAKYYFKDGSTICKNDLLTVFANALKCCPLNIYAFSTVSCPANIAPFSNTFTCMSKPSAYMTAFAKRSKLS